MVLDAVPTNTMDGSSSGSIDNMVTASGSSIVDIDHSLDSLNNDDGKNKDSNDDPPTTNNRVLGNQ